MRGFGIGRREKQVGGWVSLGTVVGRCNVMYNWGENLLAMSFD